MKHIQKDPQSEVKAQPGILVPAENEQTLQLEVDNQNFVVHYQRDSNRFTGTVYPIDFFIGEEYSFMYQDRESGGETHRVPSPECLVSFTFSFCWRGVWEGRTYFPEAEYWGEDLLVMSLVWDKLSQHLKQELRALTPGQVYPE